MDIQRDWDVGALHGAWPGGPDTHYVMDRLRILPVEVTGAGLRGPVLEVAAAEALHACRLSWFGPLTVALEPSPAMLVRARERMAEYGVDVPLVRGIAETLPFRDASFDRVLCESAIDHFASPERGIAEMARVLRPDGQLVLGFVNYGGLSVRASRIVYRAARALGADWARGHLFWDSPVPEEHTFEATYARLVALCRPHLELERAVGVSLGWAFPGWGWCLGRVRWTRALWLLHKVDRVAWRVPRLADYVLMVWRRRPLPQLPGRL